MPIRPEILAIARRMARPQPTGGTPVNGQITDAVTQSAVSVLAQAPAVATGSMFQAASHSIGILYQNAVQTQRNNAISSQASANQGVIQVYNAGTMASAMATSMIAESAGTDQTTKILKALKDMNRGTKE